MKKLTTYLSNDEPLPCVVCGRDLLSDGGKQGNVIFVSRDTPSGREIVDIYCCCMSHNKEARRYLPAGCSDAWRRVSDLAIPRRFFVQCMAHLNHIRSGDTTYSDDAFDKLRRILLCIAQLVVRPTTQEEQARLVELDEMPFV